MAPALTPCINSVEEHRVRFTAHPGCTVSKRVLLLISMRFTMSNIGIMYDRSTVSVMKSQVGVVVRALFVG